MAFFYSELPMNISKNWNIFKKSRYHIHVSVTHMFTGVIFYVAMLSSLGHASFDVARTHAATAEQTQNQKRTAQDEQEETFREIVRGGSHWQLRQMRRPHRQRRQSKLSSAWEIHSFASECGACGGWGKIAHRHIQRVLPQSRKPNPLHPFRRIQTNRLL